MDRKKIQKYIKKHKTHVVYASIVVITLCIAIIILFTLSRAGSQPQQYTRNVDASADFTVQQLQSTYYGRVPNSQKLLSIAERHNQAGLSEDGRQKAAQSVYFVAKFPSLSGSHPSWTDPATNETIPGRSWTGVYDIFPISDFDDILNSNLTADEAKQALEDRKQAIWTFMERFHGTMLNETLFSKYRIEIVNFPEWIQDADRYDKKFREKYGFEANILGQNPNIIAAGMLGSNGYTNIDILIDRNVYRSTIQSNEPNQYSRLFQELSDEGVGQMAAAIQKTHETLNRYASSPTYRYVYMNEIDFINCYHNASCDTDPDEYYNYKLASPDGYAQSYYKLARRLADDSIILMPSTFGLAFGEYVPERPESMYMGDNGLNPWIEAMAKHASLINDMPSDKRWFVQNQIAMNLYGSNDRIQAFMNHARDQIALANEWYGTDLSLGRIQEFGMLPQQPERNSYSANLPVRREEIARQIDALNGTDAAVYGQTTKNLAPWDGRVPQELLDGQTEFDTGFIYRDEPELWGTVRDRLNAQVGVNSPFQPNTETEEDTGEGSQTGETGQDDDQPQQDAEEAQPPQADVNCPRVARDAGVTNTCPAGLNWRGCYCDTQNVVDGRYVWVNSCGEEGQEEYKQTSISCGQPSDSGSNDQPSDNTDNENRDCTKNAPSDQVAQEGMFDDAMKRFCFEKENGSYKTCTGNSNECEWCFAGYCLNRD
jgi:hypothetical protein